VRRAADACTLLRLALAPVFTWAILVAHTAPSPLPLAVYALAALTDFADGRLARAAGSASTRGRLFDHGADAVFLFPGLFALAALGRVTLALPSAATVAFALYVTDGVRRGGGRAVALAPSQWGAVAGVLNYAVAGAGAVALALGPTSLDTFVAGGAVLVAFTNVAAIRPAREADLDLARAALLEAEI
jgi:phosphatidylglycerophosphate synthase